MKFYIISHMKLFVPKGDRHDTQLHQTSQILSLI